MATHEQIEAYERETRDIIRRLLSDGIGLPECVAALDAALANLVPDLTPEQLPRIQVVLLANSRAVMEELEQRGGS
jgi:regulator of RNase E activity RraB